MPLPKTRSVWLVGKMIDALDSAKPPTKKKIMQRFFKLHLVEKYTIAKSATIVTKNFLICGKQIKRLVTFHAKSYICTRSGYL